MEINKILFFDDRDKLINKKATEGKETIKQIKESILKALKDRSDLDINADSKTEIKMFYQDLSAQTASPKIQSIGEQNVVVTETTDWIHDFERVEREFTEGTLIFCDYYWNMTEEERMERKIYNLAKEREKVVFVCYSTVKVESAQEWVNDILNDGHQCKVIDTVLSFSYDIEDIVASIWEAIMDDWE